MLTTVLDAMSESRYDEERLGELLGSLPPAPGPWAMAAKELPKLERGLEQVLALAEADGEFRGALLNDLEAAIREAGVEPDPMLVRMLGARLADDPAPGTGG